MAEDTSANIETNTVFEKKETNCSALTEDKSLRDSNDSDNVSNNTTEGVNCTYTDPDSKVEYVWSQTEYAWKPKQGNSEQTDYSFDGSTYKFTDKSTDTTYIWDLKSNSWKENDTKNCKSLTDESKTNHPEQEEEEEEEEDEDGNVNRLTCPENPNKSQQPIRQDMSKGYYGHDGTSTTYTDSTDGTVYIWDQEKRAWFPKVDDTFMAYYQLSYGFVDNSSKPSDSDAKPESPIKKENAKQTDDNSSTQPHNKRKAPQTASWFETDEKHNTKVYVNNLPLDITEEEFVDLMQKCGLVMKDIDTGRMKVKLYTEPDGKQLKGDALCSYIKRESVDLALQLLDGYEHRGHKLKVEVARFTMKGGEYNAALKPKTKRRKDKEKLRKQQERLFDWRPDKLRGERSKHECVVVIKNLFEPKIFDDNLGLILEYRQDIRDECNKCGVVRKVALHDKHADGIAQVWFKEAEAADACIQLLNNRWFGQRLISAETWDGKTKYRIEETKEERDARLKKWELYLSSTKKNNDDIDHEDTTNSETTIEPSAMTNTDDTESNHGNPETLAMDASEDSDGGTRSSAGSDDETDEGEQENKIKDNTVKSSDNRNNSGGNDNS